METFGPPAFSGAAAHRSCPPSAKRRQQAAPTDCQRGIARWPRPVNGFTASSYSAAEPLGAPTTRAANSWWNALRRVLVARGRRWRTALDAVGRGVGALLGLVNAQDGGD